MRDTPDVLTVRYDWRAEVLLVARKLFCGEEYAFALDTRFGIPTKDAAIGVSDEREVQ